MGAGGKGWEVTVYTTLHSAQQGRNGELTHMRMGPTYECVLGNTATHKGHMVNDIVLSEERLQQNCLERQAVNE